MINAVYNFDNFWDGRASFIFNGVNPFGFRDRLSTLKQIDNGSCGTSICGSPFKPRVQAVGPATSNFEMSFENRTFPDVGKKMLSLRPLAKQLVHPEDSVLGSLSRAKAGSWQADRRPGFERCHLRRHGARRIPGSMVGSKEII